MKKFLKHIFIFMVFFVLLDIFFHFFITFFFKNTFSGERSGGKINYLLNYKKDINFLILGNSRALYHINPDKLTNLNGLGYNAGISSLGNIIYNTVLLEICLKNNIKPKIILLQIDPLKFTEKPKKYTESLSYLLPFYNNNTPIFKSYIKNDGIIDQIIVKSNFYKFNGKIFNIFFNYIQKNKILSKYDNGFKELNNNLDTNFNFNKDNGLFNLDYNNNYFIALNDFNKICLINNIKLFIILTPSYKNIYYNKKIDIEFSNYIKKNTPNIRLINMNDFNNFKELQSYNNWSEFLHLNKLGANKFSLMLNDSLK